MLLVFRKERINDGRDACERQERTGSKDVFLAIHFRIRRECSFFETWQHGWISTRPDLLVLCAVLGMLIGIMGTTYDIVKSYKEIDEILLQKCDPKSYLAVISYARSYGREFRFKGWQKTVFEMAQQRYIKAEIADGNLEAARKALHEEWSGKKNSRMYRQTAMNLELVEAYQCSDAEKYHKLFLQAGKVFQKNPLFIAEKLLLEQNFEQAAEVLQEYKTSVLYNNVLRSYLLGLCCDKLGNQKTARNHMQYAAEYGNTMPCREKAEAWLTANHDLQRPDDTAE